MFSPVIVKDPRPESIPAPQRQHLVCGRRRPAPSGTGVERRDDPFFLGDLFELLHVLHAFVPSGKPLVGHAGGHLPGSSGVHIFVFDLGSDDRPAVLEIQAFKLLCQFPVKFPGAGEEAFIAASHLKRLAVEPVRQPAVSDFAVVEGSDPYDHVHPVFFAKLQELPDVAVSVKTEFSFFFLMMVPENVGGNHIDPAHLHLEDRVLPLVFMDAGIMAFAADAEKRLSVDLHIISVKPKLIPLRVFSEKLIRKAFRPLVPDLP